MLTYGLVVDGETGKPEEAAPPAEVEAPPEATPASPGESPSGSEAAKPVSAPEAGKESTQETQAAPPVEPKTGEQPKFENRRKQLERQVARLHEDLDLEKGGKAALQAKLDAATAELAKLKPAEAAVEKPTELVRPKRPTKADADYDEDRYEQLLDAHETAMADFTRQTVQKELADAKAEEQKQRAQSERQSAADRAYQEYVGRLQEDMKGIPDYDAIVAEFNESVGDRKIDVPENIETHIQIASEHPGYLTHFFLKDHLNNGGKELARIAGLNPYLQLREMNRLESRLEKEYAAKPAETPAQPVAAAPPAAAAPKAPEVPAKPKLVPKMHDEPITPVGARAAGPVETLEKAASGGTVAYMQARHKGINR